MIDSFVREYEFLSNFYPAEVIYQGVKYKNNEAAFQAQKTKDIKDRFQFASLNPSEAKKLGRRIELRSDWEQVKTNVMYEICLAKFTQNAPTTISAAKRAIRPPLTVLETRLRATS